MSLNSTSPVATESNGSSSGVSSMTTTPCDDRTCSTAKCALCLHCSQQYCFVHFLKHNEQLSLNAYNFTVAIDQLEDQIKNLKLDESLRRTIYSLDQWRKNLVRTIEFVYQEKLSSIKANYIQLSHYLQQFQFEQSSHIQTLRVDLEQMKFIRSTYDQEMEKIQMTIKQLQKNLSDLQYDLQLKEGQPPNIYDSINCEIVWKRNQTEDSQRSTSEDDEDINTGVNHEGGGGGDDDDVLDYSTTGTSTPSPATYEHCLLSFLVGNDSSSLVTNKDEKTISSNIKKILPMKRQILNEKKRINNTTTSATILNSNNKKRRVCVSCGKCYHPSSLQRHYRQCNRQSMDSSNSNSKLLGDTMLKIVTNTINQPSNLVDA
ncbi:unnamed protein product [Adineta ricciae]|uniref:Uncharacterized protein n=1 Tax=Adineta ricciae TaxID=249248 RepID=A0A814N3D8_ADIRI|nr:unnamed protein product [Adineta ricciae]CAF1084967.1 unnamed protein product [Adineta ricciae]